MTQKINFNNYSKKGASNAVYGAWMIRQEQIEVAKNTAKVEAAMAAYVDYQLFIADIVIKTTAARAAVKAMHDMEVAATGGKKAEEKAARTAATNARKERQAAKATAVAKARKNIAAKTAANNFFRDNHITDMVDGEYKISIPAAYGVKIADAAKARSIAVYGGNAVTVQAYEVSFDGLTGKGLVIPQLQRKADCLEAREGFLALSKYQFGYTIVQAGKIPECWVCRTQGLTDEVMPIMLTGNMKKAKEVETLICRYARPVILVDNGKGAQLYVYTEEDVVVNNNGVEEVLKNVPLYVDIVDIVNVNGKRIIGVNTYTVEQVKAGAIQHNSIHAEAINNGKMPQPIRAYMPNFDSSSTQRKGDFVLRKISIEDAFSKDEERLTRVRRQVINEIGANVLANLDELNIGKDIPMSKLVKKVGRPSLLFTNSARGAKPSAMLFYTGTFNHLGVDFADGFGFISEGLIRKSLAVAGFEDVKNVCGLGFQCRIVTSKGYCLAVNDTTMRDIVWAAIRKIAADKGTGQHAEYCNIVRIDINDSEAVHNVAMAIEKGEYKDTLILVADDADNIGLGGVEYFADGNMLKAAFDFDKAKEVSIMEMCHASHGTCTSSQILESAISVPDFKNIVMEIAKETIDHIFEEKAIENISHKDMAGFDGYSDNILGKLNMDYVLADANMAKRYTKTLAKAAANAINNLRFNISGGYMKALPDLGGFFTSRILNPGEIYTPDMEKLAGENALIVRYPHTATSEFIMARIVGRRELFARVAALKIGDDRRTLWNLIRSIKKGQVILPSLDNTTVAKLGGSDFDGDGVIVITDKRIVSMYEHLNEGAVDFKPENGKDVLKYTHMSAEVARHAGLVNGNASTGEVVNLFYLFRSLAYDIKINAIDQNRWEKFCNHIVTCYSSQDNKFFPWKNMIASDHVNNRYGSKQYSFMQVMIPPYRNNKEDVKKVLNLNSVVKAGRPINDTEVRDLIDSVIENHIAINDLRCLKAILESLDPAGASIVGRIIDAVKTGEDVTVPFAFIGDFVRNGAKIDCTYDEVTGKLVISNNIGFSSDWEETRRMTSKKLSYYVTANPCYFVKKDLVAYVNEKIDEMIGKTKKEDLSKVHALNTFAARIAESMARVCTDLLSAQAKTSMEDVITPTSELLSYTVSMFRGLTASMNNAARLTIAKNGSRIIRNGEVTGFGKFYQALGAENILAALNDQNRAVRTEVFAKNYGVTAYEGEMVTLEKGMSDKFFAEHKVNACGRLVFKNGRTFIESTVMDMAQSAIAESISKGKVVFQVKLVKGLDANDKNLISPNSDLTTQVKNLRSLIDSNDKEIVYTARNYVLNNHVDSGNVAIESDRLVIVNNSKVACYVVESCEWLSRVMHGKTIKIDHAIMAKNGVAYVFGHIAH